MAEEKKIRVAIIAGQLVVGGAERQLYLWLSNMDRNRYSPIVLTLHPGHNDYWEKPIERLSIPLVRIPQMKDRIKRLNAIIKVLQPFKPDMIHGWHLFSSVYAGLAAKILRTLSIGGVRNTYQTYANHKLEVWLVKNSVNALIANSNSATRSLQQNINQKGLLIFPIQNAIEDNYSDRENARTKLIKNFRVPEGSLWISSIGRMDPLKRFDLLIKVFSEILKEFPNIHLVIVGDGPEKEVFQNQVAELNITPNVTFTGEVGGAGILLRAFDIFSFTSLDEGMPNVIMEAAAAGLPIVTWKLPFYEELLENEVSGLLVEPEDLEKMKESIIRLIKSPELRQQLGNKAREKILENFSLDRYIQNMTAAYEEVLKISEHRKNQKR